MGILQLFFVGLPIPFLTQQTIESGFEVCGSLEDPLLGGKRRGVNALYRWVGGWVDRGRTCGSNEVLYVWVWVGGWVAYLAFEEVLDLALVPLLRLRAFLPSSFLLLRISGIKGESRAGLHQDAVQGAQLFGVGRVGGWVGEVR